MLYRLLFSLVLTFSFVTLSAQLKYHRLYETSLEDQVGSNDTTFYHMSSTTNSGDVFAMGTKRVGEENLTVIFTKHDNKGNIDWSSELDFGVDTVTIGDHGRIAFNEAKDSILFAIHIEVNGNLKEVFGRLSLAGGKIDLNTVGGNQFATFSYIPSVAPFFNQSDLLLTPGDQPTISRFGLGNELLWSRSYRFTNGSNVDVQNVMTDMVSTEDSTIFISGTSIENGDFLLAELDSNGVQLWAQSYSFADINAAKVIPFEITPLLGGNLAVVGEYTSNTSDINGFIAVVDTMGAVLISKKIYLTENFTSIRNVLQGNDGSLWMSGIHQNQDSIKYFTTNMTLLGDVLWTTIYNDNLTINDAYTTSLISVQATGGATLIGHGFLDEVPVLQVMKHNVDGSTPCSDTTTTIIEDLSFTTDTLVTTAINGGIFLDTLVYELSSFGGFTPPVLTINQYQPFCPNEQIDTFLVASVGQVSKENITYLWSTGEFTDTIRVTMEGQYSVTVTISEDVCYSMCDTVELTRYMLPGVSISQDNAPFCETGTVALAANFTPGAPNQTYLWSTGETTPIIIVDSEGPISVTVTDGCGEMASDDLNVLFPVFDPMVIIASDDALFCKNGGQLALIANYSGGGNFPVFEWSTGENGDTIFVSEDGTYSVIVTDECGFTASSEISIELPESMALVDAGVNYSDPRCEQGEARITALYEGDGLANDVVYTWSSGDVGKIIFVSENGTYMVTVTNGCGTTATKSVEVDIPIRAENVELTFELDCDAENIANSKVVFVATSTPEVELTIQFGNVQAQELSNPTPPQILGKYFVIVSDFCGIVFEDSIFTTDLCGGTLRYPIAFFPNGTDEASKTFGPIPNDTMNIDRITDVEFKVFNRWGETVFESSAILEAWDGTHKGDPAPSEVYIWYVSYILDGRQMLDKGDVTLLRNR